METVHVQRAWATGTARAPWPMRCPPAKRWSSTSSSSARAGGACRRDPSQAAVAGDRRGGGGEGLRGRRAHPVRRGDRSGRARPAASGMAHRGHADQDRGHRRPLLLARPDGGAAAAELHDAAADVEPRQLSSSRSAMSAAGLRPRPRRWASRSIRALPRPKCCSRTARWLASRPATWASPRTASRAATSPAAWSCAPSTRCSPKARAAACPRC